MKADLHTQALGYPSMMNLSNMRVSMRGNMIDRDDNVVPSYQLEGKAIMGICEDMATILENFAGIHVHPLRLYEEYLQYEAAPTIFEQTLIHGGLVTAEEIKASRDRFRNTIRHFAETGEGVFQRVIVEKDSLGKLLDELEMEKEEEEDVSE